MSPRVSEDHHRSLTGWRKGKNGGASLGDFMHDVNRGQHRGHLTETFHTSHISNSPFSDRCHTRAVPSAPGGELELTPIGTSGVNQGEGIHDRKVLVTRA